MATVDERFELPVSTGSTPSASVVAGAVKPPPAPAAERASVRDRPDLADQTTAPATAAAQPDKARRGGSRRRVVLPLLALVIALGGHFGYRYWEVQQLYVSTDNAQVAGSLVPVGSMNAGQVASIAVDVGQRISKGQTVAVATLPSTLSTTSSGTPKLGFRGTDDQTAPVISPIDGVVVARSVTPGSSVAAGQAVLTLVDPSNLWVEAQVDETKIGRVRVGQSVEVTVDSLGRTLPGQVVAVNQAAASAFSLLPQGNTSGTFTKVTQLVPVKIAVDYGQTPLVLASSVEVRIRVQG